MTRLGDHLEKIVIVLSTGRTGTTALARYLSEGCTGVVALHEPKPSRGLRIASGRHLAGRLSAVAMTELLSRKRKKIVAGIDQRVYVESNPFLFGFLDVLGDVFPQPKIIHVTRDPRTMIRSALNFGSQRGLKWLVTAAVPFWLIKPDLLEANPERRWREMSAVERIAWYWKVVNAHLDRGAELYGDDYCRVRYEDVFTPDGAGLKDLIAWMGLEERPCVLESLLAERVNRSRANVVPAWDDWEAADRQALEHHCADLMQSYGYGDATSTPEADTSR